MGFELVFWQVAFDPIAFRALGIEDQDGGGPSRVEPMEPGGMFLDVRLDREKICIYESSNALIRIRLGFQPSTSASSRRGAEIEQDGPARFLRFRQSGIDVFAPLNCHASILQLGKGDGRLR